MEARAKASFLWHWKQSSFALALSKPLLSEECGAWQVVHFPLVRGACTCASFNCGSSFLWQERQRPGSSSFKTSAPTTPWRLWQDSQFFSSLKGAWTNFRADCFWTAAWQAMQSFETILGAAEAERQMRKKRKVRAAVGGNGGRRRAPEEEGGKGIIPIAGCRRRPKLP